MTRRTNVVANGRKVTKNNNEVVFDSEKVVIFN